MASHRLSQCLEFYYTLKSHFKTGFVASPDLDSCHSKFFFPNEVSLTVWNQNEQTGQLCKTSAQMMGQDSVSYYLGSFCFNLYLRA